MWIFADKHASKASLFSKKTHHIKRLSWHNLAASYEPVAEGIYQDLHDAEDTCYRMSISYQLESDDDVYPLEDILDQFLLHVIDFYANVPQRTTHQRELAGALEDLIACREIVGKTAYNQDFSDQGVVRTRLVIA